MKAQIKLTWNCICHYKLIQSVSIINNNNLLAQEPVTADWWLRLAKSSLLLGICIYNTSRLFKRSESYYLKLTILWTIYILSIQKCTKCNKDFFMTVQSSEYGMTMKVAVYSNRYCVIIGYTFSLRDTVYYFIKYFTPFDILKYFLLHCFMVNIISICIVIMITQCNISSLSLFVFLIPSITVPVMK